MTKLKPVAGPGSARAPTLQGTLSLCPQGTLQRIAQTAGVPISSLATLLIHNSARKLYNAVLQYAALGSPSQQKNHVPLFVDSYEDAQEESDEEISDEDDDAPMPASGPLDWAERVAVVRQRMIQNQGLHRARIPVPQYKCSLGEATISWPPPPHLQAAALVEERDEKCKRRKLLSKDATGGSPAESIRIEQMRCQSGGESKRIHVLHYSVGEPQVDDCGTLMTYCEVMLVSSESPEVLRRFADEVVKWAIDKSFFDGRGQRFALHRFKVQRQGEGWWKSEGMKRARPTSSIILPRGQVDAIMNDVRNFIKPETKRWYVSHGLQHRRAYLFYGPPGTGKTSTIRAIASTFRLNCCFLSMTNANFSNQLLCDALSDIPGKALIVLEDVDALFNEDRKNDQAASLTFSGLLNALDGLISTDGVITVMTTNHIDRLDSALIRGGRVDRRFFFNKPSNEQLKDLFLSFYPGAKGEVLHKFLDRVMERPEGEEARSIATLQQLFIDQRESSAEECVEAMPKFYEAHFPTGTDRKKSHIYT